MKKDVVMFRKGNIVDFRGVEHPFIVCALSTSNFQTEEHKVELSVRDTDAYIVDSMEFPRAVFIGISVCNPEDNWDEEKGKMIALAKAKGFNPYKIQKSAALFATRSGLISEPLVNALLDKEVQHVIDDPESVIKGYNKMKLRYESELEKAKFLEKLPEPLLDLAGKLAALTAKETDQVITAALIKSE